MGEFCLSSPHAESARAVTGSLPPLHRREGEDFFRRQPDFFTKTAESRERKIVSKVGNERLLCVRCQENKTNGSLIKIGVVWQKSDFLAKKRDFWPKKKRSLLQPNHVLAKPGKSCSKKKVGFFQINISVLRNFG